MSITEIYKGKVKIPMDHFVPKNLFDLCILCEEAIYEMGYTHTKSNEFIKDDGVKGWLYYMDDHIIWSKSTIASYYVIKTEKDIDISIRNKKEKDITDLGLSSKLDKDKEELNLIYAYHGRYGFE